MKLFVLAMAAAWLAAANAIQHAAEQDAETAADVWLRRGDALTKVRFDSFFRPRAKGPRASGPL